MSSRRSVLGSGYATWVDADRQRVIALRLSDRRRSVYELSSPFSATQTGRRLFVMQTVGDNAAARTYVATLPRAG